MKTSTNDGVQRCHHYTYEAIWNQCDPEKLIKELDVGSSLEDKPAVGKPNHNSPEDEVEKSGIAEKSYDHIVDDYSGHADKFCVDLVSGE